MWHLLLSSVNKWALLCTLSAAAGSALVMLTCCISVISALHAAVAATVGAVTEMVC